MVKIATFGILWAAVGAGGCGPARPLLLPLPSPQPQSDPSDQAKLKSLKVEIPLEVHVVSVESSEARPRLPDPGDADPLENVTRTTSETLFHTQFFIPKSGVKGGAAQASVRHQFFVWAEEFAGSKIRFATYSHRVLRNGEWLGNFRPKKVWYDDVHSRWFIPFFDIFQESDFYSESDVHLEDLQVLTVDLSLESGLRLSYQIQFQIVGPLPELIFRELELPVLPDPRTLGDQVSTVGWVIKKEELVNPSHHSLHLWLRPLALDSGALALTTYLRSSIYTEQPHSPPRGPETESWVSRGGLKVSEVRIRHLNQKRASRLSHPGDPSSPSQETRPLSGDWQSVLVAPGETLVLEWLAHTQSGVRDCTLPDTQNFSMVWTSPAVAVAPQAISYVPSGNLGLGMALREAMLRANVQPMPPMPPSVFHQNVANEWFILGAEISGRWSRDLVVSYSFLSKEGATQGFLRENIATGFVETHSTVGEIVASPAQFGCQGVFR